MKLSIIILFVFLQIYSPSKVLANENFRPAVYSIQKMLLHSADGESYQINKFAGNVLVIHFWATWCSNCKEEMLSLDRFQREHRDKPIIIIPLSEDFKGKEVVEKFYRENKIDSLLNFIDVKNQIFSDLRISGLPTSIIIDSSGRIVGKASSKVNWQNDKIVHYLMQFYKPKPVVNQDYQELIDKYKAQSSQNISDEDAKSKVSDDSKIPKSAITNVEPLEIEDDIDNNGESKEIRVTNPDQNEFSLKIRRPANKKE